MPITMKTPYLTGCNLQVGLYGRYQIQAFRVLHTVELSALVLSYTVQM